ncbi:hypothetical protein GALMADRAFT_228052 [Galerina marginata CBS 339.88]|uniref:Hydrophobin n=1 Tax=Galerina marginata (strain CBS 339.88) TaxID=685588 RepID=A0A067T3L0_GALM3|nr:hypothetical protein GALMADRAFT_228052 [Galerina marginata CBS 339.88]
MFAFKSLIVLALPILVTATPLTTRTDPGQNCNNGSLQCCNETTASSGLLGILGGNGLLGLGCSPIIGVLTGTSCPQQTACCTGTTFNGLINIGCTNINL